MTSPSSGRPSSDLEGHALWRRLSGGTAWHLVMDSIAVFPSVNASS
jgi:hypothetical protein